MLHWALWAGLGLFADPVAFNYAEALQKSLYFYEAQQAGQLSPNNRVAWRGSCCPNDGHDLGRDLSGGWFDAGDHWTANLTMSFAAMTLAWSAIEQPDGWRRTGQMDELLESLIHVNRYFLKCVLNPDCADPARDLEVAIGCGGREGVEAPNVHAMWAPAEVAHLMTSRPTFRLNRQVPGGDIPAAMAAAMAASAQVIRAEAGALAGKRGYDGFDAPAFADLLLDRAAKLWLFARANDGPVLTDKLPKDEQETIRAARNKALRGDGRTVEIGYRAAPFDKLVAAAGFLQRAHLARDPNCGREWFDRAVDVYDHEYTAENNNDFWKDYGAGNFGKVAVYNLMRLAPSEERFHRELQLYCKSFTRYQATPGGLRLREWHAHEYGSLRHANNAAVVALYYSAFVEQSPPLKGNNWWLDGQTTAQLRVAFEREARRQVDYALGANPYGRSYLVGFGRDPFNDVHHRGAYGAWAGFEHFIRGKADDRATARHILYGALVAGPDHNDVFLCGRERRPWLPLAGGQDHDFFYRFPNRAEPVRKEGYTWDPGDQPVQDVMDSQFNEVALDYNAGFTASLAWLCAHGQSAGDPLPDDRFPPPVARNRSLDPRSTDREFFVTGRRREAHQVELTLWNRSRWPARVASQLSFRVPLPPAAAAPALVQGSAEVRVQADGGRAWAEVAFPGDAIYPGNMALGSRTVVLKLDGAVARPIGEQLAVLPQMLVYDGDRLVSEP